MIKFRNNLHPAFFEWKGVEWPKTPELTPEQKRAQEVIDNARKHEQILQSEIHRNNESLASSVEKREDEITDKELLKQLKQLAKNKKINFSWNDETWKCSRAEKKLATSSAKVFEQALEQGKLRDLINKCKSQSWALTDEIAEKWKSELLINSKTKDIQNFYEAYKEYQSSQSEYQHLKNLMGFFCESNFENLDGVREALRTRSVKISKQEIKDAWKMLYQEGWVKGADWKEQYVIIDNKTHKEIESKPKDWKQRASFEIIKRRLWSENITEEKMLQLLWDFNLDGEVNSGDVGYKTWSQFVDVFRRSVASLQLKNKNFNNDVAVKNIVEYANKYGMDMWNISTIQDLYKWMTDDKNWYENTRKLQNFINNLPVEISDVIKNWKDAGAESLNNLVSAAKLEKKEAEALKVVAKQKADEIIKAGESKLKEYIKNDNQRASITQSLRDQLPQMLIDEAVKQKNAGLAAGASVSLDEIVKWMSAGFNVGLGWDGEPKFWLFLWWGKWFDISDTVKLRTAVSAGAKLLFIPCEAASIELSKDINKGSRDKTLDATWEKRISLWGNIAVTWPIFSYGVTAWYENNKDTGIEKQSQNINKVVKKQAKEWVKVLKTADNKEFVLKEALKTEFPNASEEELKSATANLMSIINQFKIDEKATAQDFDTYAQVIADVYATQWRNAKMAWLADNKRKISGWKVWIQFIAWCVPVLTLVARFTKYRNARTNESEYSRYARIDAQVNGQGNEQISLWNSKEIWETQVKQINEILKRYGAKYSLIYSAWKDWKPWHIMVPASVADGIWINIRVSENLKDCVKNPGVKALWGPWYEFPANATYRLLQETGGNQRSLTLNIGSAISAPSDVMISDAEWMKKLLGNKELMWTKKLEYKPAENKGQLDYDPKLEGLFTSAVIEWLKTIDSSDRRKFSEFMKTKRSAVDDFNKMVNAVINVLWKDKKYEAIKNKLLDKNTSAEDKQLIIDRIMAISASANVHNANGLNENLKLRKNYYKKETMKGPNWQSIFDKLSVDRDEFIKTLNGKYGLEPRQNLLWATAFYNRNNSAKWLALTWLGATNVLWGKTQELTWADKQKAEAWFLGWNDEKGGYIPWVFEKSPIEWDHLKKVVELKAWKKINDANLSDLLKKWEIILDNWQKKTKIKLDMKYVFYLMWECANESVGIELWNIQVQEEHEVDDYRQWALYLNNSDGTSTVNVARTDRAVGVAVNLWSNWGGNEEESYTDPKERDLWTVDKTGQEGAEETTEDQAGNWDSGGGTHKHR